MYVRTRQGIVPNGRALCHVISVTLLVMAGVGCQRMKLTNPYYIPRVRDITITTVPLLSTELRPVYSFLAKDFARGGVLAGQEVYAFVPSTVVVVEGDTIHFRFINPEDDAHSVVLPGLAVALPGQSTTRAIYIATRSGVYTFTCSVPSHQPTMWGQLVVLTPSTVARMASGEAADPSLPVTHGTVP